MDGTADMQSFAFSFAICPDQAKMFVNWALDLPKDVVHWHMHLLRVYPFEDDAAVTLLKHDLNNVLDWGIKKRKHTIVKQAQKFRDHGLPASAEGTAEEEPSAKRAKTAE